MTLDRKTAAVVSLLAEISTMLPPPKITVDTQPTLSVTLWRCVVCGKWSHAKRRPKHHERAATDADLYVEMKEAGRIVDEHLGYYNQALPNRNTGRFFFRCGPFEKWEAWKVESG